MEPQTYLSGERIQPMALPDFKQDFKNYDQFDIGAMGEFDVAILIDQYAGGHGVARPVSAVGAAVITTRCCRRAGIFFLHWACCMFRAGPTPEDADEFAAIYAKSLAKRYEHVHGVAEAGQKTLEEDDLVTLQSLPGKHCWQTEEGDVTIDAEGDTVMVSESLDGDTMKI